MNKQPKLFAISIKTVKISKLINNQIQHHQFIDKKRFILLFEFKKCFKHMDFIEKF